MQVHKRKLRRKDSVNGFIRDALTGVTLEIRQVHFGARVCPEALTPDIRQVNSLVVPVANRTSFGAREAVLLWNICKSERLTHAPDPGFSLDEIHVFFAQANATFLN
jgi:hypothetical protein